MRSALRARAAGVSLVLLAGLVLTGLTPDAQAATVTRRVVAFGDSVPYGSACACLPFPTRYGRLLAAQVGGRVLTTNLSRPGETSRGLRTQVETLAARQAIRSATTVLVMIGANDYGAAFRRDLAGSCAPSACYGRTTQLMAANVAATLARIRALHPGPVRIVVLGYWNIMKDGAVGRAQYGRVGLRASRLATHRADATLWRVATAARAVYVSTWLAFQTRYRTYNPTWLLAADGDHPNALGHRRIAWQLHLVLPRG